MTSENILWCIKPFNELLNTELYDLLTLRVNVFIVEQTCAYPETDGKDLMCHHVMGYHNGKLIACARIVPAGGSYDEVSLGRVAIDKAYRRGGYGVQLMQQVMKAIEKLYGQVPVRISAQSYLIGFYGQFGFVPVGTEYLEDDMPHIEMLREVSSQ